MNVATYTAAATWHSRRITGLLVACAVLVLAGLVPGAARADGPVGKDPSSNTPPGPPPLACQTAPRGATCIAAAVQDLNHGRASLGQKPYALPSDFASLTPAQQAFVLTNLDRIQYGLPPITGLTAALSQDAAGGASSDRDPRPSDPNVGSYTSNWAGGSSNMPMAYDLWMYDDGPGSPNADCGSPHASGCWGHRHDVLWRFDNPGKLAMGAASGRDPQGMTGFAMLLGSGSSGYQPSYTYTWSQAVANGAGSGTGSGPGKPTPRTIKLTISRVAVRGHGITVTIKAPRGASLRCALTRRGLRGYGADRYFRCGTTTNYTRVAKGSYRLRVRSARTTLTRYVTVR